MHVGPMNRPVGISPMVTKGKSTTMLHIVPTDAFRTAFQAEDLKALRDIKPRRPAPKVTKPSNWKDSEVIESSNKKSDGGCGSHIVNLVDDRTLACFPTGKPLNEAPDVVQCKHCRKPVIRLAATSHIRHCLRKKQEKLQKKKEAKEAKDAAARREKGEEDEPAKAKGSKKSAVKAAEPKKAKKRKVEVDVEKPPAAKKKKKEEAKAKMAKAKMPVDVERQCGVVMPNGSQCARSLTCKSHSMGAKRAVPGRSLPYDMLLAQYQKKNQAKQQRAAIDANAPPPDEFETSGPVDPDEEKTAVLAGIAMSFPRPIYDPRPVDIRRKYEYVRLKGILATVRGSGLFSTKRAARPDGQSSSGAGPADGSTTERTDDGADSQTASVGLGASVSAAAAAGSARPLDSVETGVSTPTQVGSLAGREHPNGVTKLKQEAAAALTESGSSMMSPVSEVMSAA